MIPVASDTGEVTEFLRRLARGDDAARDELAPRVYNELHKLARFYLHREKPAHAWQTTDLLNEAFLKLVGNSDLPFNDRAHFYGIAAQTMRRILTDYARRRNAEKRGGNLDLVPLHDNLVASPENSSLIADLDEALCRLEKIHPQAARVVELRFFGGLTNDEIAALMNTSLRTVGRQWLTARAWLFGELNPNRES